jgi:WS/DGAT/MGAT family acyltransferase
MPRYTYERLSVQDALFLWSEKPNQPMHVGGLAILEAAPVKRADGSIDIESYRRRIESVLHWIPRYRQKLAWTPIEGWPVWVDDRQFDLGYHIRHIALPKPGTIDQLKELAARINARALDRRHALWEIWMIEGVEGGEQFALLNKVHHCMIDGAAGADLSQILLSPSPRAEPGESVPYMPRPAPTPMELLRDSIALSIRRPIEALRGALDSDRPASETDSPPPEPGIERRLRSFKSMAQLVMGKVASTPLNGELSPYRRLEWMTMPLEDVKELRRALDCTINDVVLATVTEAVRRYLFRRRVDHREIDFRISAPVSTRREEHDRRQGNHVSSWVVRLPLALADPLDQLDSIRRQTNELKRSEASLAVETLMEWAEWLPGPLLAHGFASIQSAGPVNMIVTNVPGPQFPLYMGGAKLLGLYPIVPLLPGGGLSVALFSYEGKLCWGFNGDYELVPDLAAFVDDVRVAFESLRAAGVARFMERRTSTEELPDPAAFKEPIRDSEPSEESDEPGKELESAEYEAPIKLDGPTPLHVAGDIG